MNTKKENTSVYFNSVAHRKLVLPFDCIGGDLKQQIEEVLKVQIEGKCIHEGYVKQHSVNVLTYSSGLLMNGDSVIFEVVFECDICLPTEGMIIDCFVKNITKAGIRALLNTKDDPMVIFIARDHHYDNTSFNNMKEGQNIRIKCIGQRYELNDKYVSVLGELVPTEKSEVKPETKIKM